MEIKYTRAMLRAAIDGGLDKVEYHTEPFFGLHVPKKCPGVPEEVLNPRDTWSNKEAYDEKAENLAEKFVNNFEKYIEVADKKVVAAGPKISEK